MRFTLRQLSYFVAAGETGSVTLASEKMNISQPSISAAITQLEAEFQLQLFVRHHAQGLSLTPSGERMLHAARLLLKQADALHDIARDAANTISGPLNIGSFKTLAPLILPELCQTFLAQHPRAELKIFEGDEAAVLDKLRRAEISLAITYSLNVTNDLNFEPLTELPTYILLSTHHPLAQRQSLKIAELAEVPFILLDLPLSRDYFMSLFHREGLKPNILMSSENPETVRSYVASQFGYSLLTARPRNMYAVNGKPLTYIRLEGNNVPMVLGLATLREFRKTRIIEAFEHHCRALISRDDLPGMAPLNGATGNTTESTR